MLPATTTILKDRRFSCALGLISTATVATLGCFPGAMGITGSGIPASESRTLDEFDQIVLIGSEHVKVELGDRQEVLVRGDDNLLPHLATQVSGRTLEVVSTTPYHSRAGMSVSIIVPRLQSVNVNGSGSIEVEGIQTTDFKAIISGSGHLTAAGTARTIDVTISGSGSANLGELLAEEGKVIVSGSGGAHVHAQNALTAIISGSGEIVYQGKPQIDRQINGSGSLRAR